MPEDQTVKLLHKYKQQTPEASRAETEGTAERLIIATVMMMIYL
jgi:hypothetical protein